jgi:hypothetical protein
MSDPEEAHIEKLLATAQPDLDWNKHIVVDGIAETVAKAQPLMEKAIAASSRAQISKFPSTIHGPVLEPSKFALSLIDVRMEEGTAPGTDVTMDIGYILAARNHDTYGQLSLDKHKPPYILRMHKVAAAKDGDEGVLTIVLFRKNFWGGAYTEVVSIASVQDELMEKPQISAKFNPIGIPHLRRSRHLYSVAFQRILQRNIREIIDAADGHFYPNDVFLPNQYHS